MTQSEVPEPVEPAGDLYDGIDFANREKGTGRCFVHDDGAALTVTFEKPPGTRVKATGVDCPFGTSAEFYRLLTGTVPVLHTDGSCESRATERWARRVIGEEYRTPKLWNAAARKKYGRDCYFHPTSHVQPAVGLRIVPACLYWLARHAELPGDPKDKLKAARRGEGAVVEAHPRLFLYSMVERVRRAVPRVVTASILNGVADYKDKKKKESHRKQRKKVYEFLRCNREWCGSAARRLEPAKPDSRLIDSDHTFDAWLSALTAWAVGQGETIRWQDTNEPGMDESRVEIEGHFLILDHER